MEAAGLNEDGRKRKVVVTGCLAQRYAGQLAADLPEADLVVGFQVRVEAGGWDWSVDWGLPERGLFPLAWLGPGQQVAPLSCSKDCVQLPRQVVRGSRRPGSRVGTLQASATTPHA